MIIRRFLQVIMLATLAGCNALSFVSPYRIEIQQGNWIAQDMVARLKPGMTKDQVRFVLGTPLLVDPFHTDRWDYVYSRSAVNSRATEQRRIVVFFADDRLTRVEGDVVSAVGQSAQPDASKAATPGAAGAK